MLTDVRDRCIHCFNRPESVKGKRYFSDSDFPGAWLHAKCLSQLIRSVYEGYRQRNE